MTSLANPKDIKLVYFDLPVKGEPIRLALHIGGIAFKDERMTATQWHEMKSNYGPFAQIPLMEVDGKRICQAVNILLYVARLASLDVSNFDDELRLREIVLACDEIPNTFMGTFSITNVEEKTAARIVLFKKGGRTYCQLKRIEEFVSEEKEFLVGDKLTVADLAVFTYCSMLRCGHFDGFPRNCLDAFPKLKIFCERIAALPKVREYYEKETGAWAAAFRPMSS